MHCSFLDAGLHSSTVIEATMGTRASAHQSLMNHVFIDTTSVMHVSRCMCITDLGHTWHCGRKASRDCVALGRALATYQPPVLLQIMFSISVAIKHSLQTADLCCLIKFLIYHQVCQRCSMQTQMKHLSLGLKPSITTTKLLLFIFLLVVLTRLPSPSPNSSSPRHSIGSVMPLC